MIFNSTKCKRILLSFIFCLIFIASASTRISLETQSAYESNNGLVVNSAKSIGIITTHSEIIHGIEDLQSFYEGMGHTVDLIVDTLTPELTSAYEILFAGEGGTSWLTTEITAIEDFVANGGTFTGIGDSSASDGVIQIAANHDITFMGYGAGLSGSSTNIDTNHPVMTGVTTIYLGGVYDSLSVSGSAQAFIWDSTNAGIYGASADSGAGHICILADDFANDLYEDDNEIMFENILSWALLEHEIFVTLDEVPNIALGELILINATVTNGGSNIENNIELELWIDEVLVASDSYLTLVNGSSEILQYLWNPTEVGNYNITAYAVPVLDENVTSNNIDSEHPTVFDLSSEKVAILNSDSSNEPSYWTGGWANNYQILYDGLLTEGINVEIITNNDIISGGLSEVKILIMVDNAPNDAASAIIKAWSSIGGKILSFDSSICFNNWAGILPPEAEGTNGYETYWDYNSPATGIVIADHPIVSGYAYGETIYGTAGDAQYLNIIMESSLAGPYYTPIVKNVIGGAFDLIVAYDPPTEQGALVQIWDAAHWSTTTNQLLILNTIYWLQGFNPSASVDLLYPIGGEIVSSDIEISWNGTGFEEASLNYTLYYWDEIGSSWVTIVENITATEYIWDTTAVVDGNDYKIRVRAYDGSLERFDESDEGFTVNNVNEAPSILVLTPNGGETADDTLTISWTSSDPDFDTLTYTLYYREESGSWIEITSVVSSNSYVWHLNSIADGNYYVRIIVSDGSLTAEDSSDGYFTITHVNNPPTLDILQPIKNHAYSGNLTIEWTSTDPESDTLTFTIYYWNGSQWVGLAAGLTTTTYTWDTTTVPNGFAYKIKISATDGEFTVTDETGYFSIDNDSPTETTTTGGFGINPLVTIMLTISVFGLTIGLIKRKKS